MKYNASGSGQVAYPFGWWAALAAFAASIGYAIPQLLQVAGFLGDPLDRILIFVPSLVLAPAFVAAMAALHATTPPERHGYSLTALAFAIMYAAMVSIVYITQLGVVIPHDLRGEGNAVAALACCAPGRVMTGIDLLGYTMMSLSTLVAAPSLTSGSGTVRPARLWFAANGALAPVLIAQLAWPKLIYVGALWLVTFPAAMWCLAQVFRRGRDSQSG